MYTTFQSCLPHHGHRRNEEKRPKQEKADCHPGISDALVSNIIIVLYTTEGTARSNKNIFMNVFTPAILHHLYDWHTHAHRVKEEERLFLLLKL